MAPPGPTGGAYSSPPDPVPAFRGRRTTGDGPSGLEGKGENMNKEGMKRVK